MPYFKSWKEIEDFEDGPTVAEKKLKYALEEGEICELGPADKIPPKPDNWFELDGARHIRADVLNFLLTLSTASEFSASGLWLEGAFVSGWLYLDNATISMSVNIAGCRFENDISANNTHWQKDLFLNNCGLISFEAVVCQIDGDFSLAGSCISAEIGEALDLQRAEIWGDLNLRDAQIIGTLFLPRLILNGSLDCCGLDLSSENSISIDLHGAEIKANFLLRDAQIIGGVFLPGLSLEGELTLQGTQIEAKDGTAICLQGANVPYGLNFIGIEQIEGRIDLNSANISTLIEDPQSLLAGDYLTLNGLTYTRIIGPTGAKTRLKWLERGDTSNGEFAPQPYKQLAKVLHEMGHESDATTIRVALAEKLAKQARQHRVVELDGYWKPAWKSIWYDFTHPLLWLWHKALHLLTDYGYRPIKSFAALAVLVLIATLPAKWAWDEGSFAPNSAPILTSPEWRMLVSDESIKNPARRWTTPERADDPETDWPAIPGKDWETFNAFAYAADVVIPIVEFGQTDAWAPSTERGFWGYHLWWLRWVFTTLGWIVTALGAAALTGIIRRE